MLRGLQPVIPEARIEPCLWGPELGARLQLGGASIPDFSNEVKPDASAQNELGLWELLSIDPTFELRQLAYAPNARVPAPPSPQSLKFPAEVAKLGERKDIQALLSSIPGADFWPDVFASIAASNELSGAVRSVNRIDGNLRAAVARACVATWRQRLLDWQQVCLSVGSRNNLIDLLVDALGGREQGAASSWILRALLNAASRWATGSRRKREIVFSATYPLPGDVLKYQSRGQPIRDFIERRIDECGSNVTIIAHSLGGIACVDLLAIKSKPAVTQLITVGSQVPLLYELGALKSLEPGQPLPEFFPRWLNVYDRNDMFSFLAEPVFKGQVEDLEIQSGLPFPDAHSGYWEAPKFWHQIKPWLKPKDE